MEKVTTSKLKEICKFKFGEEEYTLIEPSAAAVREAKFKHNKAFTQGLKDGIFTRSRMQKELEADNPEFFKDFNEGRQSVVDEINETEKEIEITEDPDILESLSNIVTLYRAHLVDQEQMMRTLFSSTCDEMAEEERNSYLAYAMIRDTKGNRLAESYEDFLETNTYEFFDHCKYQLICWEYNLDPTWQEELPEAKAILKAKELRAVAEEKAKELKKNEEAKKEKKVIKKVTRKASTKKKTTTKKKPAAKKKAAAAKKKIVVKE